MDGVIKAWEPVAGIRCPGKRWLELNVYGTGGLNLCNLGNTWPDICCLGTGGQSNVIREQESRVRGQSHVDWEKVVGVFNLGTDGSELCNLWQVVGVL